MRVVGIGLLGAEIVATLRTMDLGLRASLVNFALAADGGSTDGAFELVAQIEATQGVPSDVDGLRRFMAAIERAAVETPIG